MAEFEWLCMVTTDLASSDFFFQVVCEANNTHLQYRTESSQSEDAHTIQQDCKADSSTAST